MCFNAPAGHVSLFHSVFCAGYLKAHAFGILLSGAKTTGTSKLGMCMSVCQSSQEAFFIGYSDVLPISVDTGSVFYSVSLNGGGEDLEFRFRLPKHERMPFQTDNQFSISTFEMVI